MLNLDRRFHLLWACPWSLTSVSKTIPMLYNLGSGDILLNTLAPGSVPSVVPPCGKTIVFECNRKK